MHRGKVALLPVVIITCFIVFAATYHSTSAVAQEEQLPMKIGKINVQDQSGKTMGRLYVDQSALVAFEINNNNTSTQKYVAVLQGVSAEGQVQYIKWTTGTLLPANSETIGFTWTPEEAGMYELEAFAWTSLDDPMPLAKPSLSAITVIE
jgi:hypothetical protein